MESNINPTIIGGIIAAILSPLVTGLGLYYQYYKDKSRERSDNELALAEAEKIRAEAKDIDSKADVATLSFFVGLVNTLRTEVSTLTELSKKNGGEIAMLTAKLAAADSEKAKLAEDNEKLLQRISKYEKEVEDLRLEVSMLRNSK